MHIVAVFFHFTLLSGLFVFFFRYFFPFFISSTFLIRLAFLSVHVGLTSLAFFPSSPSALLSCPLSFPFIAILWFFPDNAIPYNLFYTCVNISPDPSPLFTTVPMLFLFFTRICRSYQHTIILKLTCWHVYKFIGYNRPVSTVNNRVILPLYWLATCWVTQELDKQL